MILSLRQLAAYSDEFSEFFTDRLAIHSTLESTYSPSPEPIVQLRTRCRIVG